MLQNTYFCAPNPQSQAYIHYQGINLYPMNLIYAPTSPSYFFISDFQGNIMHQLFNKNAFEHFNHQIQPLQLQYFCTEGAQSKKKVQIQTNVSSSVGQGRENDLFMIKKEQFEGNQHQSMQKNQKTYAQRSQGIQYQGYCKSMIRSQRHFCTRKGTQEISRPIRQECCKQIEEEIQLDGIGIIKEWSKQLIIYILKNQESKSETLQALKYKISQLISQRINKERQTIQESLDHIVKILSTKFSKFKKTKEEMIKYIFRRIFNAKNKPDEVPESSWKLAQKIHKKNSSTFKSMNMKFVEKQFQNPIFGQLFSIFLNNFQSNFEKQNQDRIDRLNFIVASAIITQDMSQLKSYKKMPWNKGVARNIQKLFGDLKQIQKSTRQSQIGTQSLDEQQQLQMDGGESSFIQKKDQNLLRSNTNQSIL